MISWQHKLFAAPASCLLNSRLCKSPLRLHQGMYRCDHEKNDKEWETYSMPSDFDWLRMCEYAKAHQILISKHFLHWVVLLKLETHLDFLFRFVQKRPLCCESALFGSRLQSELELSHTRVRGIIYGREVLKILMVCRNCSFRDGVDCFAHRRARRGYEAD
jgi:hypothetical protein